MEEGIGVYHSHSQESYSQRSTMFGMVTHRVKLLRVPLSAVMRVLYRQPGLPDSYLELPDFRLPEGTQVVGAWICQPGGGAFDVIISHPSFPEVPDTETPPRFEPTRPTTWTMYAVATEDELAARRVKAVRAQPQELAEDDPNPDATAEAC